MNALEEATTIREVIENIAILKDCALLGSIGIYDSDNDGSSESSESETDSEDGTQRK